MADNQEIKDLEEKLLSTNVDMEVLKSAVDELKESIFSLKSDISELKIQKIESPKSLELDYDMIAAVVIESKLFQESIGKAVGDAVAKLINQQTNSPPPSKRHTQSQDVTAMNAAQPKHEKKRIKSDTDHLILPTTANSTYDIHDFQEEMKKLQDRVEFLERTKGKSKTGLIRRNSFDALNEDSLGSESSLKEEIQKIWGALNNMIDNFQDQINHIKSEVQSTKTSVYDTLYANVNDGNGKLNAFSMSTSTRVSNGFTFNTADLEQEIDSKVESKFNSLQSVLTKTVDSQMEMLRTEMVNHKIKIEQRIESMQQLLSKQIASIEERLGPEFKNEWEKSKEKGDPIVSLSKINEKLKGYDNGFANISKNLSNFNISLLKQENAMNSSLQASQESINSIWVTIGLINQRLAQIEESRNGK